jgi:hypothetical protein
MAPSMPKTSEARWEFVKELDSGGQGTTYLVKSKERPSQVAVLKKQIEERAKDLEVLGFLWTVQLLILRGRGRTIQWPRRRERERFARGGRTPRNSSRKRSKCFWMGIQRRRWPSGWALRDRMSCLAGRKPSCIARGRLVAPWETAWPSSKMNCGVRSGNVTS